MFIDILQPSTGIHNHSGIATENKQGQFPLPIAALQCFAMNGV